MGIMREGKEATTFPAEEVLRTAELAGLHAGPDLERVRESLGQVLQHFSEISHVPDDMAQGSPVEAVVDVQALREDIVVEPDSEGCIAQAPDFAEGHFFVPRVVS